MSQVIELQQKCTICTDDKKEFVVLICGHSVCTDCLHGWIRVRKYNCIYCRKRFEYSFMMLIKRKYKKDDDNIYL